MIQSTSNIGFNRTDAFANAAAKHSPAPEKNSTTGDRLSQTQSQALQDGLNNTPEVRPEVVERGNRLAIDPNYPPLHIIEQLAKLMVESRDPSN